MDKASMRVKVRSIRSRDHTPKSGSIALAAGQIFSLGLTTSQVDALGERIDAYVNHLSNQIHVNSHLCSKLNTAVQTPQNVVQVISIVKQSRSESIDTILHKIKHASVQWSQTRFNDDDAVLALRFATRLWLFSSPDLSCPSQTLGQTIKSLYPYAVKSASSPAAEIEWLSLDFSFINLSRRGGFYPVWTSNIEEHLTFASHNHIRIFAHACALEHYMNPQSGESMLFPDGFLKETYQTLHLLFPFEVLKTSKRVRRTQRNEKVDIQAPDLEKAMDEYRKYNLGAYRFYGPRLAEIQHKYNLSRPHRLQQWWWDRRQRTEWATLMIALVVFVLTVLFGIIQSVTGIMQVWAALRR